MDIDWVTQWSYKTQWVTHGSILRNMQWVRNGRNESGHIRTFFGKPGLTNLKFGISGFWRFKSGISGKFCIEMRDLAIIKFGITGFSLSWFGIITILVQMTLWNSKFGKNFLASPCSAFYPFRCQIMCFTWAL